MNDLVYSGNEFIEAIVSICEEKLINFMKVCNCSFNYLFFLFSVCLVIVEMVYIKIFSCDAEVSVDTTHVDIYITDLVSQLMKQNRALLKSGLIHFNNSAVPWCQFHNLKKNGRVISGL